MGIFYRGQGSRRRATIRSHTGDERRRRLAARLLGMERFEDRVMLEGSVWTLEIKRVDHAQLSEGSSEIPFSTGPVTGFLIQKFGAASMPADIIVSYSFNDNVDTTVVNPHNPSYGERPDGTPYASLSEVPTAQFTNDVALDKVNKRNSDWDFASLIGVSNKTALGNSDYGVYLTYELPEGTFKSILSQFGVFTIPQNVSSVSLVPFGIYDQAREGTELINVQLFGVTGPATINTSKDTSSIFLAEFNPPSIAYGYCPECECGCTTVDVKTNKAKGSGQVEEQHLIHDTSPNPHPIIRVDNYQPQAVEGSENATRLKATLYFGDQYSRSVEYDYSPAAIGSAEKYSFAIQADLSSFSVNQQGIQAWTMLFEYFDGSTFIKADLRRGLYNVLDWRNSGQIANPYGHGWNLKNMESLQVTDYGLIWRTSGERVTWFPAQVHKIIEVEEPTETQILDEEFSRTYSKNTFDTTVSSVVAERNYPGAIGPAYIITDQDGTTRVFDRTGRLRKITDPRGNQTVYSYAGSYLQSISYPDGRVTEYIYENDMLSQTRDKYSANSLQWLTTGYEYTDGLLTKITLPDPNLDDQIPAPIRTFVYDTANDDDPASDTRLLRYITDEVQNEKPLAERKSTQFIWDYATRQLQQVIQACGGVRTIRGYRAAAFTTEGDSPTALEVPLKSFDPTTFDFASLANYQGKNQPLPPAKFPLAWEKNEAGYVTFYAYDERGFEIEKINALGQRESWTRLENGIVTSHTIHDPDGEGPLVTSVTTFEYDTPPPNAPFVGYHYNLQNIQYSSSGDSRNEIYTYANDQNKKHGIPSLYQDVFGRFTRYTVSPTGLIENSTLVKGSDPDGPGNLTVFEYTTSASQNQPPLGLLDKVIKPDGKITKYIYNSHGQIEQILENFGLNSQTTTSFQYDPNFGYLKQITDELGRTVKYTHDRLGNILTDTVEASPGVALATTIYKYNIASQVTEIHKPNDAVTIVSYDDRNRIEFVRLDPDATGPLPQLVTQYKYDCVGNMKEMISPNGTTTKYEYDALNRPRSTLPPDPDGELGPLDPNPKIEVTYDGLGRLSLLKTDLPFNRPDELAVLFLPVTRSYTTAAASAQIPLERTGGIDAENATETLRFEIISNNNPALFDRIEVLSGKHPYVNIDFAGVATGTASMILVAIAPSGKRSDPISLTISRTVVQTSPVNLSGNYAVTSPSDSPPRVAHVAGDRFVTVFTAAHTNDTDGGIILRDSSWNTGTDADFLLVNATTANPQSQEQVAVLGVGSGPSAARYAAVTWRGLVAGSNVRAYLRIVNLQDRSMSPEITVDLDSSGFATYSYRSLVAAIPPSPSLPQGGFAVAWNISYPGDYNLTRIEYQVYDVMGVPVSGASGILTNGQNNIIMQSLVASFDGGFTIGWTDNIGTGSAQDVNLRHYNGTFQVSLTGLVSAASSGASQVLMADGGIVLVWSEIVSNTLKITARRYGADGTPAGNPFVIAEGLPTSTSTLLSATRTDDQGFVVAYRTAGTVLARRYSGRDVPLDPSPITVLSSAGGEFGQNTGLEYLGNGALTFVWRQGTQVNSVLLPAIDTPAAQNGSFRVLGISPGQNVLGDVRGVVVSFSDAINATAGSPTLSPENYTYTNPDGTLSQVTGVSQLSRTQVLLTLSTTQPVVPLAPGEYRLRVSEFVQRLSGGTLDQNRDGDTQDGYADSYHGSFQISSQPDYGSYPTPGAPLQTAAKTEYDAWHRVIRSFDELGREIQSISYNDQDPVIPGKPDFNDDLLRSVTVTDILPGEDRVTTYYYDALDRLVHVALQGTIVAENYSHNQIPLRKQFTYIYNSTNLEQLVEEDVDIYLSTTNTRITNFAYDEHNRVKKMVMYGANGLLTGLPGSPLHGNRVTEYHYDAAGQLLLETIFIAEERINLPTILRQISETGYVYDALGRVTRVILASPATNADTSAIAGEAAGIDPLDANRVTAAGGSIVVGYQYDAVGNLTAQILPDPVSGLTFDSGNLGPNAVTGAIITTMEYDLASRLTEVHLPDPDLPGSGLPARSRVYTYDNFGRLASTVDEFGHSTTYTYDNWDRPQTVTMAAGTSVAATTTYEYDNAGNLRAVTDPLGRTSHYGYDAVGNLSWMMDAASGLTSHKYDLAGRETEMTDELGRSTRYEYDQLDRLTRVLLVSLDENPSHRGQQYLYDTSGNLRIKQDKNTSDAPLRTSIYEYDQWDRLTRVLRPSADSPLANPANTVQYAYEDVLRWVITTDPLGRESARQYDALGRVVRNVAPDDNPGSENYGQALSDIYNIVGADTQYAYDVLGRVTDVVSAEPAPGQPRTRSHYDYDRLGRLTRGIAAKPSTISGDPDAAYVGYAVYPADHASAGQPVNGALVTDYLYSTAAAPGIDTGHLSRVIEPATQVGATTSTTFSRRVTEHFYDARSRLYQSQLGAIGVPSLTSLNTTGTQLVPAKQVTQYNYDVGGNLLSLVERPNTALAHATFTIYDSLNRPLEQISPREGRTQFTYDAASNRTSLRDAVHNVTEWTYDRADRLITDTITIAGGGGGGSGTANELSQRQRLFAYDDLDRLTGRTDRNGNLREFTYDNLDRLTAEHWDPQGDEALFTKYQYAHDAADDLLGVSERVTGGSALVQTHAFTRDARGRLATSQQLAGGRVWAQQFAYDDLNRRVAQRVEHFGGSGGATVIPSATVTTANGTLVGSLPGDTVTDFANHYSYDALSRLTRVTQLDRTAEGGTGVPPVGLTYAAVLAKDARLEYNAHGQWTTITRGESGVYVAGLTSATYATAGNPAEVATSRFEYDALARNTKLTHKRESQSGSAALNTYTYVFDAQNRITTMSSLDGGKSFGYDAAGQLILENAVGATEQTYTYDLNGNRARTNQGGVKPVEHAPQNRLLRDGTYQYEYDAEGHRVKRIKLNAGGQPTLEREEFSYDPRDRQTLASLYDATGALVTEVAYEYDAFNNRTARIERTFNPGTGALTGVIVERFVYDGVDVIIDLRGTGATESAAEAALVVKTRYLWADHARAGETSLLLAQEDVVALATTPTVANVLWAFGDHQGTVRDLARLKDTAGVLTIQKAAHYSFDAFGRFTGGQELNAAGTALVTVTGPSVLGANSTRYLYTSQELDRYLRTYHYNRRVYDPGSGVFTITDPIGFAAGDTNLSRYVGNGPVNKTDPSGLYTPNMDANMSGDTVIYNNIQPQPSPPPPSPPPPPSMDELQKLAQGSIRVLRSQREEIYREVAELGQLNENECTTVEELLAKYKKINEKYKAYLNELAVANKRASDLITERTIPGGSQDEALIKEINSFGLIDGLTLDEGATDSLAATFRENMEKSNAQAERLKTIEIALERTQTTIEAIETGTAVYGGVTQLAKCGFKATLAHWIKSEIKNQATQYVMNNYVAKELEAAGIDPNQVALGMRAFAALQSVCFVAGTQVVILPPPNDVKSTDNTVPHATGVPFPLASAAALVGLGLVWQNKQKTSQRQKSQHTLRRKSRPGVPVRVESQASSDDMDPTWPPAAKDSLGATTPESSLVTALATKLPATVTSGDNKATLAPSGMTSPTLAPGRHGIWGGVALLLLAIMAACGFPLMRGALERATVSASLPAHAANRLATKNIEDIVPGDMVWAADPQSGVSGPRRVVEVYRNPTHELLHLTLRGESNGKNLPEFSFVTTREHPFWTTNRGWVAAGELVPGDNVRRLDGTVGQVLGSAVQTLPTPITVYNFQVEGLHTYFVLPVAEGTPVEQDVAGLAFLVHNSCRDPETGRFATDPNKPPESPKGPHGNTADDRPATRYKKYDKDGNFRKHGVTQHEDPSKRYSKAEIDGGRVDDVDRGPRKDMLKDERREVETNPGPDNHEPWAGKNKPK